MANKGWICLHRSLQDSSIWLNDEPFDVRSAWVDLLLTANHEDKEIIFDSHARMIKRGQCLTSVTKLAARWKWSKKKTLKYLRLLEELKMITKKSDNRATLLTLLNYSKYQGLLAIEGTQGYLQPHHSRTTPDPTPDPQTTMINNDNNDNNITTTYTDGTTFTPKKGTGAYKDVKLTQFHNMETNKYDFDALEKYLLERDKP